MCKQNIAHAWDACSSYMPICRLWRLHAEHIFECSIRLSSKQSNTNSALLVACSVSLLHGPNLLLRGLTVCSICCARVTSIYLVSRDCAKTAGFTAHVGMRITWLSARLLNRPIDACHGMCASSIITFEAHRSYWSLHDHCIAQTQSYYISFIAIWDVELIVS